jgi:hypothetical protein
MALKSSTAQSVSMITECTVLVGMGWAKESTTGENIISRRKSVLNRIQGECSISNYLIVKIKNSVLIKKNTDAKPAFCFY